jgi:predicted glycosyltransferase
MSDHARKYIIELFKIVSTDSILIINSAGKIQRLYCPFRVISKVNLPPLARNQQYDVQAVKMTLKLEEVFIIDGNAYFVGYFSIVT